MLKLMQSKLDEDERDNTNEEEVPSYFLFDIIIKSLPVPPW